MIVEINEKEFEVLKKVLGEAYDAVTDRVNVKDQRQTTFSYYTNLMKRIKNALAEKGIKASLHNNGLKIGNWNIWPSGEDGERGFVGPSTVVDADPGPESGEDASFKEFENDVTLEMYSGLKHVDTADFDVRNTPSIVKWILDHIER